MSNDAYVQVPTDESGKKVASQEVVQPGRADSSTAFDLVERQEVIIAKFDDNTIVDLLDELIREVRDLQMTLLDALH